MPVALGVSAAVAAGMFLLARQNGGYDLTTWSAAAVLIWWTVALVAALDLAPSLAQARAAILPGAALGALRSLDGLSPPGPRVPNRRTSSSPAPASTSVVFVLGAILPTPRSLGRWRDGLACGIVAVGVLALVSRLFPGSFGSSTGAAILPTLSHRLSYPMGYWNGLGILLALGVPLLLAAAVDARQRSDARCCDRRIAAARRRDLLDLVARGGRDSCGRCARAARRGAAALASRRSRDGFRSWCRGGRRRRRVSTRAHRRRPR